MKVSWKSAGSLTLCTSLLKENEKWFENSQNQSILGSICVLNLWSLLEDLSQKDEDRLL